MRGLSRNAMTLRYLLGLAPGVGHMQLLKCAYLADVEARTYLGRPISTLRYRRYVHGPFDVASFAAIREVIVGGLATSTLTWIGNASLPLLRPTLYPVEYDFSTADAEVLRYVAETYMTLAARRLCDEAVLATRPMRDVQLYDDLPMDQLDRRSDDPFAFSFLRMLQAEQSAQSGRIRPIRTAVNVLRARRNG